MRIVFIGPPGSGKGTQARRIADHLHIPHLSTGDMLRRARNEGTDVGRRVAPILDCGGLVGDDLMVSVVRERLERADCQNGFLLDGFPRTIPQAEALDHMLDERGRQLDRVVELHVPDEELSRRLSVRAQESDDPRADDAPELIPRRIQLYHSETAPLLEYYRRRNMRLRVNGVGTIDEVYHRIIESIGSAV